MTQELSLSQAREPTSASDDYDVDFVAWMERQARLLEQRDFVSLDLENLIEELNGLARSERRELTSSLRAILVHLLKSEFLPAQEAPGWGSALQEERSQLASLLAKSPSLGSRLADVANASYAVAVQLAALETERDNSTFPIENPYSVAQLLDLDFAP